MSRRRAPAFYFGVRDDGRIEPKKIAEKWPLVFNFGTSGKIPSGNTITSATVSYTAVRGKDDGTTITNDGVHSISGLKVTQRCQDGSENCRYLVECEATDSDGNVVKAQAHIWVSDQDPPED